MKNEIRTDTGSTCDFCKRPMFEDVGKVECLLKKDDLQEVVILNRCCKCYNPSRPLISRVWRWAVVGVLTFVVSLLTFVLLKFLGWNLLLSRLLPIFLAAFVNVFTKVFIVIFTYRFFAGLLGVVRRDYRSEANKHKVIKKLTDQGYCLVDTKAIIG